MTELKDRSVYVLDSRNLRVGVWDAQVGGFVGIREKFGSRYLATEYLWTDMGRGTALPRGEPIGEVPPGYLLREHVGIVDTLTCRAVKPDKSGYVYVDTGEPVPDINRRVVVSNSPLFGLLAEFEEDLLEST